MKLMESYVDQCALHATAEPAMISTHPGKSGG